MKGTLGEAGKEKTEQKIREYKSWKENDRTGKKEHRIADERNG